MIIPSIHLNGTSKEELLKQVEEAGVAVNNAINKMHGMTPHDRDYYIQSPNAGQMARNQHWARINKLNEVYQELLDLHEAVSNGGFKQ